MRVGWLAFDRWGAILGDCTADNKQVAEGVLRLIHPDLEWVQSKLDYEIMLEMRRARERNLKHRITDSDDDAA